MTHTAYSNHLDVLYLAPFYLYMWLILCFKYLALTVFCCESCQASFSVILTPMTPTTTLHTCFEKTSGLARSSPARVLASTMQKALSLIPIAK